MRTQAHTTRAALRKAVWASVVLHVAVAVGLFALVRQREVVTHGPAIDTRVPHVQMHLAEVVTEVEVRPEPPAAPAPAPAPAPSTPPVTQPKPEPPAPPPETAGPAGPFAPAVPRTLPPELVALIRKPGPPAPVIAAPDPNVKPAGTTAAPAGRVLHGAFKPAQTVVYVLDCSGSMGATGKFAAARSALLATLAQQPATVRFQVLVYDSAPRSLVSVGTVLATAENAQTAAAKLAAIEPRGKSSHLVALRAALDLRPDVVVWLTDADDLTGAAIKPVLKASGRPVPVCVGLVTAAGVQQIRELK